MDKHDINTWYTNMNNFINEYVQSACNNEPHLFDVLDIKKEWPILSKFLKKPKKKDFLNVFDNKQEVTVYSTQKYETITISEYVDRCNTNDGDSLYLKDWHASLNYRKTKGSELYKVPYFLIDDWLDFWCTRCKNDDDDYRFIYVGTKSTCTKLHYDVCLSYSWSINLSGAKIWKLYRPNDVMKACNAHHVEEFNENITKQEQIQHVLIEQGIGQIIFIPSGWYHSVANVLPSECSEKLNITSEDEDEDDCMDVTMSVNQNWFNGFNIYDVWRFLLNDLNSCRRELKYLRPFCLFSDKEVAFDSVKEWCQHCDTILAANSNLNISDLLELIASRLLDIIRYITKNKNEIDGEINISDDSYDPFQTKNWEKVLCHSYLSTESMKTTDSSDEINLFLLKQKVNTKNLFFNCDDDKNNKNENRLILESFRLSSMDEIDIHIDRTCLSFSLLTGENKDATHSIRPRELSILQVSVLQILRIINEIKNSSSMMEHVDAVVATSTSDDHHHHPSASILGSRKELLEMITKSAVLLLSED